MLNIPPISFQTMTFGIGKRDDKSRNERARRHGIDRRHKQKMESENRRQKGLQKILQKLLTRNLTETQKQRLLQQLFRQAPNSYDGNFHRFSPSIIVTEDRGKGRIVYKISDIPKNYRETARDLYSSNTQNPTITSKPIILSAPTVLQRYGINQKPISFAPSVDPSYAYIASYTTRKFLKQFAKEFLTKLRLVRYRKKNVSCSSEIIL